MTAAQAAQQLKDGADIYTKTNRNVFKYGNLTKETTVRYNGQTIGIATGTTAAATDRIVKNLIQDHMNQRGVQ